MKICIMDWLKYILKFEYEATVLVLVDNHEARQGMKLSVLKRRTTLQHAYVAALGPNNAYFSSTMSQKCWVKPGRPQGGASGITAPGIAHRHYDL